MKKTYSIFMLAMLMLAAMSFTACGGSDDDSSSGGGASGGNIVGTWTMDDANRRYSCGWQFNSDGTCVFGEWTYKGTPRFPTKNKVPYSISGSTLTISAGYESASFSYSITNGGKTLVLVANSQGDDYSEMAGTYTKQ